MRVWLMSVMVGAVCCVGMGNSLVHDKGADDTELAQLLIELLGPDGRLCRSISRSSQMHLKMRKVSPISS
jgi:hypothetical protein